MLEFQLGDWRTNASLLGLIRILEHNNRDYIMKETSIEIESEVLNNFEEDYFKYFSDTYEEDLPWFKIVSYYPKLTENIEKIENIDKDDLSELNKQIEIVKDYLRRPNYKKVYPLIKGAELLEKKVKDIKKINLRKNEKVEDRLDDISREMKKLKEIINICKLEDAKKHMRAKGVIYSHINRGIDEVSFLLRQTKYIDVFDDYKNYFIKPLLDYVDKEVKSKQPYECFSCGSYINTIGESYTINLLNQTGFDSVRKSSYVWNHISDILICPKCNFLYSMISAGFSYSLYEGIFINYSRNIEGLVYANNSAKTRINHMTKGDERSISYRTIVAAVGRQNIEDLEYEESEIQIVRYKDERYIFNILSKEVIDIIRKSKEDLYSIEKATYKQGNLYLSIYDQVLDRIFNGQNMFSLIHFLLVNIISKNPGINIYYNTYHISRINNINYKILLGGLKMQKVNMQKQIYFSRKNGNALMKEYFEKGMENKISGISYRLLNALKTRNSQGFMHNIINAYMYLNKPVPQNLTLALEDEEKLGLLGYAFVTGLNGLRDKDSIDDEDKDKEEMI